MNYNSEQNLSDIKYEPLCFHSIFGYQQSEDSPVIQNIIIPKMQRDFAYGRSEGKVPQKRKNFLESLKKAITGDPITLDFIYGFTNKQGCMTPLDGQQRLTILFLLYYYAACKSRIDIIKDANYLTRFGYDTRVSARQFCENLTNFNPFDVEEISEVEEKSLTEGIILPDELADNGAREKSTETPEEAKEKDPLSEIIKNQKWFLAEWIKDPTVDGMLTMLDGIDGTFDDIENIWEALMDEKIRFYFMPLDDTGLTDDLYIKINSRGKDLTDFENFKAELSNVLSLVDDSLAKELLNRIDIQWTRKIWKYRDKETVVDALLLRYFKYLASIILCEQGIYQEPEDEWAIIRDLFESNIPNEDELEEDEIEQQKSKRTTTIKENAQKIIKYTDCWQKHDVGSSGFELMLDCCRSFSLRSDRGFSSEKVVRLYAFICYYCNMNSPEYSWLTNKEFNRRLRMLDHLLTFSYDALSHRERMPILIEQTRQLILIEDVSKSLDSRSNGFQVRVQEEELLKYQGLANGEFQSLQSVVFKLEDHPVFNGFIGLVGYENVVNKPEIVDRFYNLLPIGEGKIASEKLGLVAKLLLSVNQKAFYEESKRISKYPCCNLSSWQDLAAPQRKVGETHELTSALLSILGSDFSQPDINQKINSVLAEVENSSKRYDFTYYYMKYSEFLDPEAYLLVNYRRAVQGRFSRIYNWEIDPNHDRSQTDAYELVDNCYVIPTTVTLGGLNLDVHLLVIKQLLQKKGWQNLAPNEYAYQSYYSHGYCELGLSHGYELRNTPLSVMLVKKDNDFETECWQCDIPQNDNCDAVDRIKLVVEKLFQHFAVNHISNT